MNLSSELITEFVKTTNDKPEQSKETTVYGTIMYDGKYYVKLDGSELLTPITTTTDVKDGDRVMVTISNHTATVTGNTTSPAARTHDVQEIGGKVTDFEIVMAYRVTTEDLSAVNGYIETLRSKLAVIDKLSVVEADIYELEAKFADVEYLTAKDIQAITATIDSLTVKFGEFTDVDTESLEALNADITNLRGYTADFTYVSTDVLDAVKASIRELDTNKLSADQADIRYANIDFANVDSANIARAWFDEFYANSGMLENVTISEGVVVKELVGVKIRADDIYAGTLSVDRLAVKGSDGLYYALNVNALGQTAVDEMSDEEQKELQEGIHGSTIIAKTIVAEQISVDDLKAFKTTIGGFKIDDNAIHSVVKDSVNNSTRGIYLDNDGQMAVGDGDNYIKYHKVGNDYKLEISSVDKLKIGARNLIRNSKSLIFQDYYFESQAPSDSDAASTAILGTGVLGTMILGKES